MSSRPETTPPVIVALAGIGYGPNSDTEARARHAARLWHDEPASSIIFTGAYPSTLRQRPSQPFAAFMKTVAEAQDVNPLRIRLDPDALTTIENALNVKPMLSPGQHVRLVTSDSHMPRTLKTFKHVWGPSYPISGSSSGESHEANQARQERAGNALTYLIFKGTTTGDDAAIAQRHAVVFPGKGPDRIFSQPVVVRNAIRLAGRTAVACALRSRK